MTSSPKATSRGRHNDTNGQDDFDAIENDGSKGMLYRVDDVPPWYLCILLGLQQYLTMFSSAISMPYILAPAMCMSEDNPAKAHLVSSLLFTSGIITILQTTFGIRLPIVQGGTVAFLIPVFSMLSLPEWKCPEANVTDGFNAGTAYMNRSMAEEDEMWQQRMRVAQGSIVLASLLEIFLGASGLVGLILRFITPLTIVPTISLVGLSLFQVAIDMAGEQWGVSLSTVALLLIMSQYLQGIAVPIPKYTRSSGWTFAKVRLFALLPVLITIVTIWGGCFILTACGVFVPGSPGRTDRNLRILNDSPWARVPYPGQWGPLTVNAAGVIGIFAGIIASVVESIGDYYACARLSGAPAPPPHAINRGIFIEGVGCVIAGLFGTGVGTTSYSENIGAIGITKVASRRVIQFAGIIMLILGTFTKFGALFVSIPNPIVGGIFLVMFGMITAVGLSNLQFVDLNSSRNLLIVGFSIFLGLAVPNWVSRNKDFLNTGSIITDQVIFVLLSTSMLIGGLVGCFLDNTIPGTPEERGLIAWKKAAHSDQTAGGAASSSYDIPFVTPLLRRMACARLVPIFPTFDAQECARVCFPCRKSAADDGSDTNGHHRNHGEDKNGKENHAFDSSNV